MTFSTSTSTTYTIRNSNAPDETLVIRPVAGEPGLLELIDEQAPGGPAVIQFTAEQARLVAVYLEKAAKVAATELELVLLDNKGMTKRGSFRAMA